MKCRNRGVTCALIFVIIIATTSIVGDFAGLEYFIWPVGVIVLLQPLALIIIAILLACRIHNFYKGAAKMRMIWIHVFNFLLVTVAAVAGTGIGNMIAAELVGLVSLYQ